MLVGGEKDVSDGGESEHRQGNQNAIPKAPQRIYDERRQKEKLKVRRQVPSVPEADVVGVDKVLDVQERGKPVLLAVFVIKFNHVLVVRSIAEIPLE